MSNGYGSTELTGVIAALVGYAIKIGAGSWALMSCGTGCGNDPDEKGGGEVVCSWCTLKVDDVRGVVIGDVVAGDCWFKCDLLAVILL